MAGPAAEQLIAQAPGPTLDVRRLHDEVIQIVRQWILDGVLPPGTRLRVADLAQRLGVSPMPVREALRRLEASGLVETAPRRGAWVARLDAREIEELYDLRIILEPEAARRAAERMNRPTAALLRARLGDVRAAVATGDLLRLLDRDEAVLAAVFDASGNRELVAAITRLWDRVRPYKLLHLSSADGASGHARIERWSAALVKACIAGDAARAAECVRTPLEEAKTELVAFSRGLARTEG